MDAAIGVLSALAGLATYRREGGLLLGMLVALAVGIALQILVRRTRRGPPA